MSGIDGHTIVISLTEKGRAGYGAGFLHFDPSTGAVRPNEDDASVLTGKQDGAFYCEIAESNTSRAAFATGSTLAVAIRRAAKSAGLTGTAVVLRDWSDKADVVRL